LHLPIAAIFSCGGFYTPTHALGVLIRVLRTQNIAGSRPLFSLKTPFSAENGIPLQNSYKYCILACVLTGIKIMSKSTYLAAA
jgi:hypothetical protein